jgi:hypothetical protein
MRVRIYGMNRAMRGRGLGCGGLTFTAGVVVLAAVLGIRWLLEGHLPEHWQDNIESSIVFLFGCAAAVEIYAQLDRAIDQAVRDIKKEIERVGDQIKEEIRNRKS